MLSLLTTAMLRWIEASRRRAELRALLRQNDRALEDIGLTRSEIEAALNQTVTETARGRAYRTAARTMALDGLR